MLEIRPITFRAACAFIAEHHRHNKPPRGHKFSIAVYSGETLVGVATAGRPVARAFDNGRILEANRTCTDGTRHVNSMLYGAIWRAAKAMGYRGCVTYTQGDECGASLRAAGWRKVRDMRPRAGWAESTGDERLKALRDPIGNGGVPRHLWAIGEIPVNEEKPMHRAAVLAFPDDQGEPQARLILERVQWERADAGAYLRGERPRTAAWLMCNPSRASHEIDDAPGGRVVHHSARAGCPRSLVGNVWAYRTPYPDDLWAAIARGEITDEMAEANLDALCMIGAQADIHVVAFGAAPRTRFPLAVARAVEAFSLYGNVPLYCLGTTPADQPLHPLARGKFAVRNDAQLRLWRGVNPVLPWEQVFSDKQRVAGGWIDR